MCFLFFGITIDIYSYYNDDYSPFDIIKYDKYDGIYFSVPATKAQCEVLGKVNNSYSLDVNIICEDKYIKKSLNWTKLKDKKIYIVYSKGVDTLYIALYPIVKDILVQYKNEKTGVNYSKVFSYAKTPLEYNSIIAMIMGFEI